MLGGVFQGRDLFLVACFEGFAFESELFLEGLEARLLGGRIYFGASLLLEPPAQLCELALQLCELVYVLVAEAELLVGVLLFEGGELRPQILHLAFGLGTGLLLLFQRLGPGGDLFLRGLQRRGGLLQVAPQVSYLLLQALDQDTGRLHALRERGRLVLGILAHDRLSCVTHKITLAERLTPGRPAVKTLLSVEKPKC